MNTDRNEYKINVDSSHYAIGSNKEIDQPICSKKQTFDRIDEVFQKSSLSHDYREIKENNNTIEKVFIAASESECSSQIKFFFKGSGRIIAGLSLGASVLSIKGKIVGEGKIIKSDDQSEQKIVITKLKEKGEVIFTAYLKCADVIKLGDMTISHLRILKNGEYGDERRSITPDDTISFWRRYGREVQFARADRIFVHLMKAGQNNQYKGIGTNLIQTAIEYGFRNNCEGRLQLDACWNSHGFYYKMGLRSHLRSNDQEIAMELENAQNENRKSNTEELGSVYMYLPSAEIPNWSRKIKENPVLYPKVNYACEDSFVS
ncbi:MAG: GNAT family N-acetyltransferase [Parachlamydiaceae bacterium]|nr:GNAT family N-acetyltransferase [Parachlamydiaceae bacterium]